MPYNHYFQAITNRTGDSLVGYFARVINTVSGNTVPLYADLNGTPIVTVSGVADMAKTDENGNVSFYNDAGTYHLDIYQPDATTFILRVPNVAMQSGQGPQGDQGPAGDVGASDSAFPTLAALKAIDPVLYPSPRLAAASGADGGVANGLFTYQTAGAPYTADDVNVIKLDAVPLTTGALVRQATDGLTFQQQPTASSVNDPSPPLSASLALRETTSLERWYKVGDGNWYAASRRASLEAAATGVPIKMRNRDYAGARIEVHRTMGVEGNGARIDYIGIGNTLIDGDGSGTAAIMKPWPMTDTDAMADRYPVLMYSVVSADLNQLQLNTVAGLAPGMWIDIAQDLAPNSTPFNPIPQNFEKQQIISVDTASKIIRFRGKLERIYNTSARVFYCQGQAVNCAIRDLTLTTNSDSYQWVTRSAVNLLMENITFSGENALGAGTFQQNAVYRNFLAAGSYGSFSTARCSKSVTLDGFDYAPQTPFPIAQPLSIFVEESFGRVTLQNLNIRGGGILVGSINNPVADGRRELFINNAIVDTTLSDTPFAPLAIASAIGVSVSVNGGAFTGIVRQHDSSSFAGVPPCLIPMTANLATDRVSFEGVKFRSSNQGAVYGRGGGFLGRPSFNMDTCTFDVCSPPETYARARREKSGTVNMGGSGTSFAVTFDTFMPEPYVLSLASDAQADVSWSNKSQNGFTINAPLNSRIDWKATQAMGL